MAYLVDTSAWLDYLRSRTTEAAALVGWILDEDLPFGIASVVYQELLQGAARQKDFERLAQYFSTQRFYHPEDRLESYREAALLYFRCRRAGVTIRSTVDCLIARIAIENELALVHNDRDFENMSRAIPELRLA